jgi:hypothetical protein
MMSLLSFYESASVFGMLTEMFGDRGSGKQRWRQQYAETEVEVCGDRECE